MSKTSKLEDYWKQHNIENLLKELTHTLVQRMPPDPAVAIVQYIQKKFPKSFKTSTDNSFNIDNVSKTKASNLLSQSITSPHSGIDMDTIRSLELQRQASNQSQISGIATLPRNESTFTDLNKQSTTSTKEMPIINLKNLVFANRLSQQAIRLGKDIRSDRDILEEELIKPIRTNQNISLSTDATFHSVSENLQEAQTHGEPTLRQLIKYKQQIRTENDRRRHREELADLAKQARQKEDIFQSDPSTKTDQTHPEQEQHRDDKSSTQIPSETKHPSVIQKLIVHSKEEQDILNDENVFQPKRYRHRDRQRNKFSAPSPYPNARHLAHFNPLLRQEDTFSIPMVQFGICKICANLIDSEDNQSHTQVANVSELSRTQSAEPQPSTNSMPKVDDFDDDWFESASDVSGPRQMEPWTPDTITPGVVNEPQSNILKIIKDNNNDTKRQNSPIPPLIIPDDERKSKRSTTQRLSESQVFARIDEPKIRLTSSSSLRNSPRSLTKQSQINSLAVPIRQPSQPVTQTIPESRALSTVERPMSIQGTHEHSFDNSNGNYLS